METQNKKQIHDAQKKRLQMYSEKIVKTTKEKKDAE